MAKKQSSTRVGKRIGQEVEKLERDRLGRLMNERRFCYVIPSDAFYEGYGFRVSIAIENDQGHYPTGDDSFLTGDGRARMPWFWGMTYEEACARADVMNARMGLTPLQAAEIVASTMGGRSA